MKILFFDIDGTLTETISGEPFKQHPQDVKLLPGVKEGLDYYRNQGWSMIGVSNQGGIEAGHKSIQGTIQEMQFTLKLTQINLILFCPDFKGKVCYYVTPDQAQKVRSFENEQAQEVTKVVDALSVVSRPGEPRLNFRKPEAGMIKYALIRQSTKPDKEKCWMIGDRPEDEGCATNAGISFCPADTWRKNFLKGMQELEVTPAQLKFLSGAEI